MLRVGLAMLQGARHEHGEALRGAAKELDVPVEIVECRRGSHVDDSLDALVLPGGESTTMRIASQHESLLKAVFDWMERHPGRPVLGTCAGAILLADPGEGRQRYLNASIARNAWGRQRDSFEAVVTVSLEVASAAYQAVQPAQRDQFAHQPLEVSSQAAPSTEDGFPGVFIRAPRFEQNVGSATVVATLDGEPVGVLDGARLGVTFHPELTLDRRFHRWLLATANANKGAA
jgi:5'-phosphate synthase pdxT subunit